MRSLLCLAAARTDYDFKDITDVYKYLFDDDTPSFLTNGEYQESVSYVPWLVSHIEDGDKIYRLGYPETNDSSSFHFLRRGKHGLFALFHGDMWVSASLFMHGVWSEPQIELLQSLIPKGASVVDVGANIGAFTVPMARAVGETGTVHAFEPFRRIFQVLAANVALNGFANVHTHHMALSSRSGIRRVQSFDYDNIGNFGASSVVDDPNLGEWLSRTSATEIIQLVRFDSLELGEIFLMKIDVEDHDHEVLEGAAETIQRYRPLILIETQNDQVLWMLDNWGYRCVQGETSPYASGVLRNADYEIFAADTDNLFCWHESTRHEKEL